MSDAATPAPEAQPEHADITTPAEADAPGATIEAADIGTTSARPHPAHPAHRTSGRRRSPDGRFAPSEGDDPLPADRFLDRELSWLQFNERVLQLAADPTVPLLERARFLAIFTSNLDEFFMVRVAGLQRRIATGLAVQSPSGLEPGEILDQISRTAHDLVDRQTAILTEQVQPALAEEGIHLLRWSELDDADRRVLTTMYRERIYPVLTPLAVDPSHPFPYISGLGLNLAVRVADPRREIEHFARVKVPEGLPRLVRLPQRGDDDHDVRFVPLEEVIAHHLDVLFPGMEVVGWSVFRVTRNQDVEVEEDDAENLLNALEKELTRRQCNRRSGYNCI